MNPLECNGRTLAFLGDAVWSLAVRDFLKRKDVAKAQYFLCLCEITGKILFASS